MSVSRGRGRASLWLPVRLARAAVRARCSNFTATKVSTSDKQHPHNCCSEFEQGTAYSQPLK